MNQIYYNTKSPGSFGGVDALYRQLKGKNTKKEIKQWLSGQDTYTLHKPVQRRFLRNRVIVNGINDQFQLDLADVSNISKYNKGVKFLLTGIDVFSKHAWAVPLKDKSGKSVRSALENILLERKPRKIQTDKGREFLNKDVQNLLKENDIKYFNSNNPETKASVVERFNRTLKNRIYRYLTYKQTFKYIDVLEDILNSYNSSYHRSIKMSPDDVTYENEKDVWHNLYSDTLKTIKKLYKFNVDDYVRISIERVPFRKGYKRGWTEEVFVITKRHSRNPPVYNIRDLEGEDIEGTFYEKELQKIKKPILKKKRRKRKR